MTASIERGLDQPGTTPPSISARRAAGSEEPPAWLRTVAFAGAAAVFAFGAVGLVMAVNGWYRLGAALAVGAVVFSALLVLARPALGAVGTPSGSRGGNVVGGIGIAVILAITIWNVANASEHVLISRDGGSYLNTGRWIARDGSLAVQPNVGPFRDEENLAFDSWAVHTRDESLQFQFAHLLPVLLAEAHGIGGDRAMTRAPAVLGGFALVAFFVLAWRLLRRPWFALAAVPALGLLIPQVWFTRDSYSEIPSQILLFTALWLIADRQVIPHWRVALASGLLLGALWALRIDAIVFLIGVPVFLVVAWLRAEPAMRQRTRLSTCAFVSGLVPGLILGYIDLSRHSVKYWNDLWSEERRLMAVVALSIAGSIAVLVLWRFVEAWVRRWPWKPIAAGVGGAIVVFGFAVWVFRPRLGALHGDTNPIAVFQVAEGVPVDETRSYYELSMTWMGWYLGGLTVAAAIIGAGLIVRFIILGRRVRWIAPLCVIGPGSLLYLYRASAVPDHVWTMRRFLVSSFPTFILLALAFAVFLFACRPVWARVGGVVIAVFAVAYPMNTVIGVRNMTEMRGYLAVIHDTCDELGPDAAVVVLERDRDDLLEEWVPQALRSWCGATVAVSAHDESSADSLRRLAREWENDGKQLFVVARSPDAISKILPDANVVSTRTVTNNHVLVRRLTYRPDSYTSDSFVMAIAAVDSNRPGDR